MYFLTLSVGTVRPSERFVVGLEVAAAMCFTYSKKKKAVGEVAVFYPPRDKNFVGGQ